MSQPAIIVDGISKRYRLGHQASPHQTFREMATGMLAAPFRKLRSAHEGGAQGEEFWALKDVSFEVQPGEVVGIIGRNGAGKSTLLKILSRITEPTDGQIRMRGRVASLLEVGTGFHPELTGRENIYLNGAILGMKRAEISRKFDEIVAFAETEKFLDTPVKFYSSGMYVRLAFAVAAHLEPEILIVDEVLAVGDSEFQKKCLGKMQDVATGEGRTVLFVSHNMAAIKSLCSRACLLRAGKLEQAGSPEKCVQAYLTNAESSQNYERAFQKPESASLWMTNARIGSSEGGAGRIQMGSNVWVEVEFQSDKPIQYPRLGLIVSTSAGEPLFQSHERFLGPKTNSCPILTGTIRCELGNLPLVNGQFVVGLWLGDHLFDTHVEPEALRFEVAEHDVWGYGSLPLRKRAPAWWNSTFTYRYLEVTACE